LQRWRGGGDGCAGVRACTRDHGQHGGTWAVAGHPAGCAQDAGPGPGKGFLAETGGAIGGGSTASFRCWRIFRTTSPCVMAAMMRTLPRCQAETRCGDFPSRPPSRPAGIGPAILRDILAVAAVAHKPVRIHVEKFNPALWLYERLALLRLRTKACISSWS